MNKNELKTLLKEILKKASFYMDNYDEIYKKEKLLNDYHNSLPYIPSKYSPTSEEKYNTSPKEIDERINNYKENVLPKLRKERIELIEKYKKEIDFVDYYGEIMVEVDKLPNEFSDFRDAMNDCNYWYDRIHFINSLVPTFIYVIEL